MALELAEVLEAAKKFGLERNTDKERLLIEQRDTVARQWLAVYIKVEELGRTCLFCDFTAKSRISLKTHMRAKHNLG